MRKPEYSLYTAEERRLTDVRYLASRLVAHTHEARLILAQIPPTVGDQHWRLMHDFLLRVAPGNAEAERIFRLTQESEPYTHKVKSVDGPRILAAPASVDVEIIRQLFDKQQ